MSLTWMGLAELGALLKKGDLSSVELTHHFLGRIAKADPTLHAFTEVYADQSLALAQAADQKFASSVGQTSIFYDPSTPMQQISQAGLALHPSTSTTMASSI